VPIRGEMRRARATEVQRRSPAIRGVITLTVGATALAVLVVASAGDAKSRPTCFGKPATIVGTNHHDVISATRGKDVIAALDGKDVIKAKNTRVNHGEDVVCGGAGDDKITGNNERNVLIGERGNDVIKGGPGNDLVVGDNANPKGSVSGGTSRDNLNGTGGKDFMVGDNYARGDAVGASPDKDIVGLDNGDKVIGDSASLTGDARGGAADRLAGADGNDLVVGDSYAPRGNASGSGNDKSTRINHTAGLNAGPGNDIAVGDNYTNTGTATGGGRDELQAADGGSGGVKCKPHTCDDIFYGDNYAASCGPKRTRAAIRCQLRSTSGGGADRLTTDQGNDLLNGGLPNDPDLRGDGDKCKGGRGHDVAALCEFSYRDVESKLHFP
jgi:Ca2+-binding RTX toxin-like protein